jgi:hypothetical protein
MSGSNEQQQPQAPPDLNALIQAMIQQQIATASGQGNQVQLPSAQPPASQYSNDPSKGPDLLARIGLAIGGGSLPGAPAELRQQMGKQALLNFGIGLLNAGKFSTPGEALAGGLSGARQGLLGSEAAQAGQQEYALNAQTKLAELGMEQQKNRTEALTALVPLLQMQGRLSMPPLFGPGSAAGGGGPGGGGGYTGDTYEGAIAGHEGAGQNPNSSAFGPGQFLAGTWNQFAAANPDLFKGMTPEQIQAARANPQLANQAITWLAQKNAQTLQGQGVRPTGQSLGIAHYLGAGGAASVMGAPDSDPVSKYVSDAAVKANPELATMTVGQMKARYANTPNPGFLTAGGGGPPASGPGSPVGPYKVPSRGNVPPPSAAPSSGPPVPPSDGGSPPASVAPINPTGVPPAVAGRPLPPSVEAAIGPKADPQVIDPATGQWTTRSQLGPVGPVTPPVAPTAQPPAAQPPVQPPAQAQPKQPVAPAPDVTARNDDGTYTVPDEKISTPQFQSRYRQAPTPDELVSRGLVLPENVQAFQDQQTAVANATAEAAAAHAAANRGAVGYPGFDVDKAIQAANTADKNAQDARNTYNTMVQDAAKTNAGALQKFYTDQDTQLAAAHKDLLDRQAASALETQRGQQAVTLEQAKAGILSKQKLIDQANEDSKTSHDSVTQLQALMDLSKGAGAPDLMAASPALRDWLGRIGALDDRGMQKASAQTALEAANNRLISVLRNGTGFQRTTNMDLQFLQRSGPGGPWTPEEYRDSTAQFLLQAYRHQQDYSQKVAGYMTDGMSYGAATKQADADVGPIIQQIPDTFKGQPLVGSARDKYIWDNTDPGEFYKDQNGKLQRGPDKTKFRRPD